MPIFKKSHKHRSALAFDASADIISTKWSVEVVISTLLQAFSILLHSLLRKFFVRTYNADEVKLISMLAQKASHIDNLAVA